MTSQDNNSPPKKSYDVEEMISILKLIVEKDNDSLKRAVEILESTSKSLLDYMQTTGDTPKQTLLETRETLLTVKEIRASLEKNNLLLKQISSSDLKLIVEKVNTIHMDLIDTNQGKMYLQVKALDERMSKTFGDFASLLQKLDKEWHSANVFYKVSWGLLTLIMVGVNVVMMILKAK